MADYLQASGMKLLSETSVTAMTRDAEGLAVQTDRGAVFRPEKVIVAAGRVGNIEELGLADIGVKTDHGGTSWSMTTSNDGSRGLCRRRCDRPSGIGVSFDGTRPGCGLVALGIPFKKTVYPLVPFGVYAIPECAMVGLTEEQAIAEGRNYAIRTSRFVDNSRAAIAGTTDGMVEDCLDRRRQPKIAGYPHCRGGRNRAGASGPSHPAFRGDGRLLHHPPLDVPTMSDAYKSYAAYDLPPTDGSGNRPQGHMTIVT